MLDAIFLAQAVVLLTSRRMRIYTNFALDVAQKARSGGVLT
jgi:hypothetical protein